MQAFIDHFYFLKNKEGRKLGCHLSMYDCIEWFCLNCNANIFSVFN